jgi:hypothetical protein
MFTSADLATTTGAGRPCPGKYDNQAGSLTMAAGQGLEDRRVLARLCH